MNMATMATEINKVSGINTSGPCILFQVLICPFDAARTLAVTKTVFLRINGNFSFVTGVKGGSVKSQYY